jgi:hypothetical protein
VFFSFKLRRKHVLVYNVSIHIDVVKLLLALASTVILGSESNGTRGLILRPYNKYTARIYSFAVLCRTGRPHRTRGPTVAHTCYTESKGRISEYSMGKDMEGCGHSPNGGYYPSISLELIPRSCESFLRSRQSLSYSRIFPIFYAARRFITVFIRALMAGTSGGPL